MKAYGLDTETYGLDWRKDEPWMIAVATFEGHRAWDLRRPDEARLVLPAFEALVKDAGRIYAHNAKFDLHALAKVLPERLVFALLPLMCCTVVREYLIDENRLSYKLDDLGLERLRERKIDLVQQTGLLPEHWSCAPPEKSKAYCVKDALLCLGVADSQQRDIDHQNLQEVEDLEQRVMRVAWKMERRGVRVDSQMVEDKKREIHRLMMKQQQEVYSKYGRLHLLSSNDLARGLGIGEDSHGILRTDTGEAVPKTDTGRPKLDEETLAGLNSPLAKIATEFRKMDRMANTFLDKHILARVDPKKGTDTVHPNINTVRSLSGRGTKTGRFSYDSPALQQMPSRQDDLAAIIRVCFLPWAGEFWWYGDLDQNEFRVFAHFTGSERLYKAYADNPQIDFHGLVAQILGIPRSPKDVEGQGPNAKQTNLALLFNMGAGLLAKTMGLPYTEEKDDRAKDGVRLIPGPEVEGVLDAYFAEIPGVRELNETCSRLMESRGYVTTPVGRRIRISNPEFAYKAAGLLYQATAADINKRNVVLLDETLGREGAGTLLLNIHDEYSISAPDSARTVEVLRHVSEEIADAGLKVPLAIEFHKGPNWYEATQEH
mgnify:CR=1 FL=1